MTNPIERPPLYIQPSTSNSEAYAEANAEAFVEITVPQEVTTITNHVTNNFDIFENINSNSNNNSIQGSRRGTTSLSNEQLSALARVLRNPRGITVGGSALNINSNTNLNILA